MRSAPERSTRVVMPGYFASNFFAIFSATGKSTEVYQAILPSLRAASISAGVIGFASGGAAFSGEANAPSAIAADPFNKSRRENFPFIIAAFSLPDQCMAAFRRQMQPDRRLRRDILLRRRDHAQRRTARGFDDIIAMAAEKDLPDDFPGHNIFSGGNGRRGKPNIVRADRERSRAAGRKLGAAATQFYTAECDMRLVDVLAAQ